MLSFFLSFYQKLSDNPAIIWINSRIKPVSIVTGLDAVKMADVKAKMPDTSSKLADINQALWRWNWPIEFINSWVERYFRVVGNIRTFFNIDHFQKMTITQRSCSTMTSLDRFSSGVTGCTSGKSYTVIVILRVHLVLYVYICHRQIHHPVYYMI